MLYFSLPIQKSSSFKLVCKTQPFNRTRIQRIKNLTTAILQHSELNMAKGYGIYSLYPRQSQKTLASISSQSSLHTRPQLSLSSCISTRPITGLLGSKGDIRCRALSHEPTIRILVVSKRCLYFF